MQIEVVSLVGTNKVIKGEPIKGEPLSVALEKARELQLVDEHVNFMKVPFFNRKQILSLINCYHGVYTKDNILAGGEGIPCARNYAPCIIYEFVSQIIFVQDDKPRGIAEGDVYEEKTIYVILPEEVLGKLTPTHPCDSASCWSCNVHDCAQRISDYEGN